MPGKYTLEKFDHGCLNCGNLKIHASGRCNACYRYWLKNKFERPLAVILKSARKMAIVPPDAEELTELYRVETAPQIAARYEVTTSTVRRWIAGLDVSRDHAVERGHKVGIDALVRYQKQRGIDAQISINCYWCGDRFSRKKCLIQRVEHPCCGASCGASLSRAKQRIARILGSGGDPSSQKICGHCLNLRDLSLFGHKTGTHDGLDTTCGQCKSQEQKGFRERLVNDEVRREAHLRTRRAKRMNKAFTQIINELRRSSG